MKEHAGKRRPWISNVKEEDVESRPLVASNNTGESTDSVHHMNEKIIAPSIRAYSPTPSKTRFASSIMGTELSMIDPAECQDMNDTTTLRRQPLHKFNISNILPMSLFQKYNKGFMFGARNERDATGKRGKYRVNVPMAKLVLYFSVIFIAVPLLAGLILLVRELLGLHKPDTFHPHGGITSHHDFDMVKENSTIIDNSVNGTNDTNIMFGLDLINPRNATMKKSRSVP